jgi:hypothetical protein
MNAPSSQPARRTHAARALLFVVAALLTLLVLVSTEEAWRGQRAFKQHQAALRTAGEPTELAELAPPRLPDAGNFAMVPWVQELALGAPLLTDQARSQLYLRFDQFLSLVPGRETAIAPAALADVLSALAPLEPRFADLRTEARQRTGAQFRSFWDNPIPRSPTGQAFTYSRIIDLSRLLHLHALASLAAGDRATALDDVRVLHRLAQASAADATLLSALVAQGMTGFVATCFEAGRQAGVWTASDLAELQSWLTTTEYPKVFNRALRGERIAVTNALANEGETIVASYFGARRDDLTVKLWATLAEGALLQAVIVKDDLFQGMLASGFDQNPARLFPAKVAVLDDHVTAAVTSWNPARRLGAMPTPAISKLLVNTADSYARITCAALACALERHRLETGRYPEAMSALMPRYLASLPIDLYSGKSYIYRLAAPEIYLIYSLGRNESDDGGDPAKDIVWPPR